MHEISRGRSRIVGGFLVVVLALLATPMPSLEAQVASPVCGTRVLTASAVVRLQRDITCLHEVLVVEAPDVLIDLNGYEVRTSQGCERHADEGCGIFFGRRSDGSRIVNGRLVDVALASRNADVTFSRLNLVGSKVLLGGLRNRLEDSVVADGRISLAHDEVSVQRNWLVRGNAVELFNLERAVRSFRLTGNVVLRSGGDGLHLSTYFFFPNDVQGEIAGNVFLANAGDGLHFDNLLQDVGAVSVHDNSFVANGGDGVDINGRKFPPLDIPGGPVTLARNTTARNGGYGINAGWVPGIPTGILDGGGNTSAGNALGPCIGVAC